MTGAGRVLILGGTTEGRRLAALLTSGPDPGSPAVFPTPAAAAHRTAPAEAPGSSTARYTVISSLAGRTSTPLRIDGEVRIGGFGGVHGLVEYLREQRIDAVVDATHPFAGTITRNAVEAARAARVPIVVLRRPGWQAAAGDDWRRVRDLTEAAALAAHLGDRIFLTTGRQSISRFAEIGDRWFLSRSVEPPGPPLPARLDVVLDRGPFTLDGELRLMRDHRIDVLVTKDSGGPAPKLTAARALGLPVVMVDRPPVPEALVVGGVDEAVAWLEAVLPEVAER